MKRTLVLVTFVCFFAIVAAQDDSSWFQECLQSHNDYRGGEEKPPLNESREAIAHAKSRVSELVAGCKFNHNGNRNSGYGENLYAGSGSYGKNCEQAVKSWYDEKQYYDKNRPGFSAKTGHYTQVVWRSTTDVGCARGVYANNCRMAGMTVVVCSYYPPGNFIGEKNFRENV